MDPGEDCGRSRYPFAYMHYLDLLNADQYIFKRRGLGNISWCMVQLGVVMFFLLLDLKH